MGRIRKNKKSRFFIKVDKLPETKYTKGVSKQGKLKSIYPFSTQTRQRKVINLEKYNYGRRFNKFDFRSAQFHK